MLKTIGDGLQALAGEPWLLALSLPLCVLAYRSPELVKAVIKAYATIKKSNVEIAEMKRRNQKQIDKEIDKRNKKVGGGSA